MKAVWEKMKHLHAAEFGSNGMRDAEEKSVDVSSKKIETIPLMSLAEMLYLVVPQKNFSGSWTRRLGAVLVCFVATRSLDEKLFEMLKSTGV